MNQIVLTLPKELHEDLDKKTFAKMIKNFMASFGIGTIKSGYELYTGKKLPEGGFTPQNKFAQYLMYRKLLIHVRSFRLVRQFC